MRSRTTAEWEEAFAAVDLPHAPILTVGEALGHPQVAARGLVHEVDHPRLGHGAVVGPTVSLSRSSAPAPVPAPLLGQDTSAVLSAALGLTGEEISRLAEVGVVRTVTTGPAGSVNGGVMRAVGHRRCRVPAHRLPDP